MKKIDLIRKIKETAINEMPDVIDRIDISNVHIDEPETIRSPFNLRRTVSLTFASLFLVLSGIFTYNFAYLPNVTNTSPLESSTELVGFQTVSSAALLTSFEVAELSFTDNSYVIQELSETSFDLEDNIDLVNNYLNLAETVLGSKEQFIYESIESDNPDFEFAFQYKGVDLAGNLIQYRGFYNETEINGFPNQTGIILHNQKMYQFSMLTTSNGNTEVTKYRIRVNDQNYIEVINSSNENLQRFHYKVYIDGELDNESDLILTAKKDTLRAQINIRNRFNEDIELDIQRDNLEGTMQQFNILYRLQSQNQEFNGEFTVNLEMNQFTQMYQYKYKINNQQIIIEDRPAKGNVKANDDDFNPGRGPIVTTTTQSSSTTTEGTTNPGSGNHSTTNGNPGNSDQTSGSGNRNHPKKNNDFAYEVVIFFC